MADRNSTHSVLRERIVEHCFVGDCLRLLWRHNVLNVEVLRSEFDAHGYDLVMTRGSLVRHIQLKTGQEKKRGAVSVSRALAEKPSGCVIWICITDYLEMKPFFWFGAKPGEPLPRIDHHQIPKRPTHNVVGIRPLRPNHRLVPKNEFKELATLDDVLHELFGSMDEDLRNREPL